MPCAHGQSGNPRGRVTGSGKVDKLRAALAEELPEVMNALLAQAKVGDTGTIKLMLERTVPALCPMDAFTILSLPTFGGLADQGRAVLAAVVEEHQPTGATEAHLVEELAGILWRKQRVLMAKGAAINPDSLTDPAREQRAGGHHGG